MPTNVGVVIKADGGNEFANSMKKAAESAKQCQQSLKGLEADITSAPTYDIFTGEQFIAGFSDDGQFMFTTDFVRYYKQGKVEVPKVYEDYLISIGVK